MKPENLLTPEQAPAQRTAAAATNGPAPTAGHDLTATRSGRNRSLLQGIASSLLGKATGMVAPLLIIPATLQYMGAQRYGMWMAVTSLTSMALFADFGIGNGLLTRLAASYARDDDRDSARTIASAYAILSAVAAALLAVVSAVTWLIDWPGILNIDDPAVAGEAKWVVLVCFGAFVVNIPLSLIQRVQYARRQVVQSNAWQAGGSLLSVAFVVVGVSRELPAVAVIALVVLAAPVANLLNTAFFFGFQDSSLRPRPGMADRRTARGIAGMGLRFFAISVLTSIALNADTFLVSSTLDTTAAAHYSVVSRLFATLSLFVTLVGLVLWPANGEALARGDVQWVRRTTYRASALSGVAVLAAGMPLAFFSSAILEAWIGADHIAPMSAPLLVGLLTWSTLLAVASPYFMVQNSIGLLRPQFIGWCVFLPASFLFKIALAKNVGVAGVPIAGVITYALVIVPVAVYGYRKSLHRTSAKAEQRGNSEKGPDRP